MGIFAWVRTYERHLSALAMVAGFIADNIFFGRVDLWQTQMVFAVYTAICFITIPIQHWLASRYDEPPRWSAFLTLATQFALGGFWSGFVIFYGRSADWGSSWPFLIFLVLVLLGSEYFSKYHSRLIFTSVLFFFALYSYAIFALPILVGSIGGGVFILSTVAAIGVFALFTTLLRILARERFLEDVFWIRVWASAVFIIMFVSYYTNILPPLPLSAQATGIYHVVSRIPGNYVAQNELEPWAVRYLGFSPTLHIMPGAGLSAYTSIFAPTTLETTITHRWEWYDPTLGEWILKAKITYPIAGGRDGGYRGYSTAYPKVVGKWRVSVETKDGRHIVRMPFIVEFVSTPVALETISLD